jgi:hypothetical protein
MNLTVGRTTLGRNNWPGLGALLAGLTTVGVLAGIGIWQATESDSSTPVSPQIAAPSVELPRAVANPTYIYLVDSQAEADAIYQADFEARMSFGGSGTFNGNFRVIDISTPAGQEEYNLLNAELAQRYLENPEFDASLVQIINMAEPAIPGGASNGAVPFVPEASARIATYFYVVESQAQADQVLQAEFLADQEAAQAGVAMEPHKTVIVDVSTPEGLELYNTVNGGLFEMWDNPEFDQSLVQIIDVRN